MRSASGRKSVGATAAFAIGRRFLRARLADDVDARRRREPEEARIEHGIGFDVREPELGALTELVLQGHPDELLALEPEPDLAKIRVAGFRQQPHPVEAVVAPEARHTKACRYVPGAGQQSRWRRGKRLAERTHGDLLELLVVEPHALPVGNDELMHAGRVVPAKAVRLGEIEHAACAFEYFAVRARKRLLELAAQALHGADDPVDAPPCRRVVGRRYKRRRACDKRQHHEAMTGAHPGQASGGGASTSRDPFVCNWPTSPAASIASTRRAARL